MTNRSNVLGLIEALAAEERALRGQTFLAPLVGRRRLRLRVRGIVYELRVRGAAPGWWVCRMRDARSAEPAEPAQPWQRGEYLALWPALRLVLLGPLAATDGGLATTWLALPANAAEAKRRFGIDSLVTVQLVEEGRPLEQVIGRVEARAVWYDDVDRRADPLLAEALREELAAGRAEPQTGGLTPGLRTAFELLAAGADPAETPRRGVSTIDDGSVRGVERRLRRALEIGGARLLGYGYTAHGLRVEWQRDGQRGATLVDGGLNVVSAGICLSGEDQRFDLASIMGVVAEAPDFARYSRDDW
jgi:hypothetical protein